MKKSVLLYLFLNLFLTLSANIQNSFYYHFDRLSIEQGLSHLDINDILEDENGFIWLATLNGLNKYDGYNTQIFRFEGIPTNNRNRMTSLIDIGNHNFLIASESGLFKFNQAREEFTELRVADTNTKFLLSEPIELFIADKQGHIWCTYGGNLLVLRLKNDSIQIYKWQQELLPSNQYLNLTISDVVIDQAGNYWVCSNHGVFQLAANHEKQLFLVRHLLADGKIQNFYDNYITSALITNSGDLILGNYQAYHYVELEYPGTGAPTQVKKIDFLTTHNEPVINIFNQQDNTILGVVRDIQQDRFNNLWLGFDNGLVKIEKREDIFDCEFLLYQNSQDKIFSPSANNINALLLNRDGCLFIGTYGGGVNILDTKQKRIYLLRRNLEKREQSLSDNFIRAVAEDDNQNLWIGNQNKGLDYYDAHLNRTTNYFFEDNTNAATRNSIRSVYLEKNRWLWMGTLNELLCFDIEQRKLHPLPKNITEATTFSMGYYSDIAVDKFGNLWLSTWHNGLIMIQRKPEQPLAFTDVYRFNTNLLGIYNLQSDIVNNIRVIDNTNEVMVSTQKGFSIIKLDSLGTPQKTTQYYKSSNPEHSLTNYFVWDIVEVNDSTFYMGTLGGGVNKVIIRRAGGMANMGDYIAEPLPIPSFIDLNNVECLLSDKNQNLWIAGNGLYLFNTQKNELELFDFKKTIFGNQFKVGGAYVSKTGKIYLSGVNGISYFDPLDITPNQIVPLPQFTRLEIHNNPVKPQKEFNNHIVITQSLPYIQTLKLKYSENNFTLYFSAMQFEDPLHVNYKYKLKGFDQNWMYTTGEEAKVTYSNLRYKSYILELYASNNDGKWSTKPQIIRIIVTPPWYRSKIAILIYILLSMVIITSVFIYQQRFYRIKNALDIQRLDEKKKEELFQEKMRFFTNVSHELRTPLTLMISPLHDLVASEQRTKVKSQLSFIYRNAERMLHYVNELIKFRKAETGIDTLKTVKTDINPYIRNIGEAFSDWANRKQINYHLKLLNEQLITWIDREKCETIIFNLLTNAFKHTPDGGQIQLTVQNAEIEIPFKEMKKGIRIGTLKTPWRYLNILVSDNGSGIAENKLDTVFERFYQEKDTSQGGFGIGLSLVKNNTLLHKGCLEIYSGLNIGTDVLIRIPLSEDAYRKVERISATLPETKRMKVDPAILFSNTVPDEVLLTDTDEKTYQKQRLSTKKETVLIIEDDEQIRNYLRINLSRIYSVLVAASGEEGIRLITEKMPDIVISDIMLPGIDGFEICRRIKSTNETAHIPVVMLTAKTDLSDKMTGAQVGADVYIEKPFSLAYLLTELRNILENRKKLIDKISKNVIFESHKKASDSKDEAFVNRLVKTIEQFMDKSNFSVDLICRELGIARSNFYIKVKETTGQTPNDFVKDVRLDYAVNLLVNENMPITETAYRVGMTPTFFSKAFKDKYNKTPSAYLRDIKSL